MGERDQRRGPDPSPEVEQPSGAGPDGGAQEDGIESGAETVARLRHCQPPAQKGIARKRLVFYNFGGVV